jgi:hypothetical protein
MAFAVRQCAATSGYGNWPVVVTVPIMRMVKMAIDQVIHMISMRNAFMTATRPMLMFRLMPLTLMLGRAALRVRRSDVDHMLVDMFAVHVVHMPIVQVIDMSGMDDSGMPALRAM